MTWWRHWLDRADGSEPSALGPGWRMSRRLDGSWVHRPLAEFETPSDADVDRAMHELAATGPRVPQPVARRSSRLFGRPPRDGSFPTPR